MALAEYLIFKYGKSVRQIVESPQGDNKAEMKQAQELVDASLAAFEELSQKTEQQKAALASQKQAKLEADAAAKADREASIIHL